MTGELISDMLLNALKKTTVRGHKTIRIHSRLLRRFFLSNSKHVLTLPEETNRQLKLPNIIAYRRSLYRIAGLWQRQNFGCFG